MTLPSRSSDCGPDSRAIHPEDVTYICAGCGQPQTDHARPVEIHLRTNIPYDLNRLNFIGWTNGDGSGHHGYNAAYYFDKQGRYLGPDIHGIEPVFAGRYCADCEPPEPECDCRFSGDVADASDCPVHGR